MSQTACKHCGESASWREICDKCYDRLYPAFAEASERAKGSYLVLIADDGELCFADNDTLAGLSQQGATKKARELRASGVTLPILIVGGDAHWLMSEPGWSVHARFAHTTPDRLTQYMDHDGTGDRSEPIPGLRFSRICNNIDPWTILHCPCCGGRAFTSIDGAAVYCAECGVQFHVRHTAGDPGLVVDAFDRWADRPKQRRRLWTGSAYCILKTFDNEPRWIVLGNDSRLPHDLLPDTNGRRADQVYAYLPFEIGPEWRPIFRAPYPWNTNSHNCRHFICGDCAAKIGVQAWTQGDTDAADSRDRHDLYGDPPKIGGNPTCRECGFSQPFYEHR